MTTTLPVVLYEFPVSPFCIKTENMLLLKNIPHKRVIVNPEPPRPELIDDLGIAYRRIPLLAIGRDIYCDSSLIAEALERRFSAEYGHPTLFPSKTGGGKGDTGLIKALARSHVDITLFALAIVFLPWASLPQSFLDDRAKLMGAPIVPAEWEKREPETLSTLRAHLAQIEEQLADGRDWLYDTTEPGFGDIATHFIVNWIHVGLPLASSLFADGEVPCILSWLGRMNSFLEERKANGAGAFDMISGGEATALVRDLSDDTLEPITFDTKEGERLGLPKGTVAAVISEGAGAYPGDNETVGQLVGLSRTEFVLLTTGGATTTHCHFPRLGFRAYKHQTA
ncbi:hypothetical protein BDV98DRAFT_504125 [Pterulicium gracile]|uniref:GST N-terminal domain-containing protein n=1 Tax=Pterulicium gracile TaxID=1884261 RepID=A0A5C3QNG8_9AGAR|nr:hypothetical protein BDV98DRAFT_504125 [Pterula gracilis]